MRAAWSQLPPHVRGSAYGSLAHEEDARLVVRLVTARLNRVHAAESLSGVKIGEIEPGGEEDWSKSNETYCAHIII